MKKSMLSLMVLSLLLVIMPGSLKAEGGNEKLVGTEEKTLVATEVEKMRDRMEEIESIELSDLKSSEKSELKKEHRTIDKNLKAYSRADAEANAKAAAEGEVSGGVYISGGAIIVILLLILLL